MGCNCCPWIKRKNLQIIQNPYSNKAEDVFDSYSIAKVIGYGAYGVVRMAKSKTNLGHIVAIKTIDKSVIKSQRDLDDLKTEFTALSRANHPNVIKVYESFENERFFHIVTEYCSGGELLERLVEFGYHSELEASMVFKSMLKAIHSLHSMGICHRDIKPENFLFTSKEPTGILKLIDFGLSKLLDDPVDTMQTLVGTPHYISPEILKREPYTTKCDLWSAGVILYIMLSGEYPFNGELRPVLFHSIMNDELSLEGERWVKASPEAKDLVSKLLVKDPSSRINAHEALLHPWITTSSLKNSMKMDSNTLELKDFLKKYSSKVANLLELVSDADIIELRAKFELLDIDKNGFLTWDELSEAIKEGGISEEELGQVIGQLEKSQDGKINYEEFLEAMTAYKVKMNEDVIWSAFKHFEVDEKGFISNSEIAKAISYTGKKVFGNNFAIEVEQISLGDQQITYEVFKRMILRKL